MVDSFNSSSQSNNSSQNFKAIKQVTSPRLNNKREGITGSNLQRMPSIAHNIQSDKKKPSGSSDSVPKLNTMYETKK